MPIVYRSEKGAPLANNEVDGNFRDLDQRATANQQAATTAQQAAVDAGEAAVSVADALAAHKSSGDHDGRYLRRDVPDTAPLLSGIAKAGVTGLPFELDALRAALHRLEFGDGPYPVLDLQFAGANALDPRVQFSRPSEGSYFDVDGVLRAAAVNEPRFQHDPVTGVPRGLLLEEARTNLMAASEDFQHSSWGNNSSGLYGIVINPNAQVRTPDGRAAATKFIETTASGLHRFRLSLSSLTAVGNTYSFTLHVAPGENQFCSLYMFAKTSTSATWHFNLLTGEVSAGDTSLASTPYIEQLPNGWWRIGITFTMPTDPTPALSLCMSRTWPIASATGSNYVGDGYSGVYVWGGQLELGSRPSSYIPTRPSFVSRSSSKTYADSSGTVRTAAANELPETFTLVEGVWVSAGRVAEPSRTNYAQFSLPSQLWAKIANPTITENAGIAPDGTNTAGAFSTSVDGSNSRISPSSGSFVPYGAGERWAASIWLKPNPANPSKKIALYQYSSTFGSNKKVFFDIRTGEVSAPSDSSSTPESWGYERLADGWVRIWQSNTVVTAGAGSSLYLWADDAINVGDSVLFWGAQVEKGDAPTSFIYTDGTAVTRAADIVTAAAITRAEDVFVMPTEGWLNQIEATILLDVDLLSTPASGNTYFTFLSDKDLVTGTDYEGLLYNGGSGTVYVNANVVAGAETATIPVPPLPALGVKIASTFKVRAPWILAVNGATATGSNTLPGPRNLKWLKLGGKSAGGSQGIMHYRRFFAFKKALSASEIEGYTQ